jgi:uncharacterized repeat protein (TIGR03803 family)
MNMQIRGRKSQNRLAACITLSVIAAAAPARAQTHTFDLATGQNKKGVLINSGHDANWIVTQWQQKGTNFKLPLHASVVMPGDADWYDEWVQDFTTYPSRWIAPDPSCEYCNGDYTITYTFDLTGYNLATASFSNLYWAIDDQGSVQVNGTTVATNANFGVMSPFSIPVSDLVPGVNTLTITSVGSDYNYEGARLEGQLTVTKGGPTFTTLFTFTGSNGSKPNGGPLLYDGVIYGTTAGGGTKNDGTVWGYTLSSASLSTLHNFAGADGSEPRGELSVYDGTLYGSTEYGGSANDGLIYSVTVGNSGYNSIYSFTGAGDGSGPGAGLIVYNGNTIFGAANSGGEYNFGDIFQVSLQNDDETTLYSFPGGNKGNQPDGVLTLGPGNVIYGATVKGGTNNAGTLFSIPAGGTNLTVLYKFPGGSGGQTPNGGLVFDSAGNLYGTTRTGGTGNAGTIFKYVPGTGVLTVLYSFTGGNDGGHPDGNLLIDSTGNLYGAATQDGADGDGTIFEFNPSSQTLTTLYTFTGQADGENPNGGLVEDSSGALYGTTSAGGTNGFGTLFKLVP